MGWILKSKSSGKVSVSNTSRKPRKKKSDKILKKYALKVGKDGGISIEAIDDVKSAPKKAPKKATKKAPAKKPARAKKSSKKKR